MKKLFLLLLLVSVIAMSCSKQKCEGCEVNSKVYLDSDLIQETKSAVDCGAKVGTTTRRALAAFGKEYLFITTTTCR